MYYENPDGVSVHSGFPNPAADVSLQGIDLNKLLIQNSISTYLMRVTGDDWQELGIFAGDIAIIDRALHADKTDIVAWIMDDSFVVSSLPSMPRSAAVWGIVTGVIHQYRNRA